MGIFLSYHLELEGGEGVKEIESYQEWKEELERHGKTPEEMVEWARENISEEYAGKLEEVIREYERPVK